MLCLTHLALSNWSEIFTMSYICHGMNGMLDQLQQQKNLDGGCSSQCSSYQFWLPFFTPPLVKQIHGTQRTTCSQGNTEDMPSHIHKFAHTEHEVCFVQTLKGIWPCNPKQFTLSTHSSFLTPILQEAPGFCS